MFDIERYKKSFSTTHKAELIQDTDRYLIIDWRKEDGSGDYYVNYIVDKKRGSLIVSGDLGDSIATWYNPVNPANLANYIKDIDYYISKMQCASDKYTFKKNDIFDDIRDNLFEAAGCEDDLEWNEDFIRYDCDEYEDTQDFWETIERKIDESLYDNQFVPTDSLYKIIEDFDPDCFQWIYNCGRRTHPRVYLWATGFIMACEQLGI